MNLFKTTIFRVSLQFAASFAILSIITLLAVNYFTIYEIEAQVEQELSNEIKELNEYYKNTNTKSLSTLIELRTQYGKHLQHYYALTTAGNQLIAGSQLLLLKQPRTDYKKYGVSFTDILDVDENHEIYIKTAQLILSSDLKLVVGQMQNSVTELREHIFIALIYAVAVTVVIALFIGMYMGRSVLSRINRIDAGMERVIKSDFTKLLDIPDREDEFHELTIKLNEMLRHIEKLINGIREVSDNVAHDLRSPLTRMRSRLEITLLQNRKESEYRDVMQKVIDDCDELLNIFNALLAITQAESGVFRDTLEDVDISRLVDELADLYRVVVEDSGLTFIWHKPNKVIINGSRHSLAQAISNLLENAIKYTPKGGQIEINVSSKNNVPSIVISDSGPGIPAKDRQRVLERFQRLDSARTKSGNGLGLSLVSAVAKLHHANLILEDNKPGLRIEIRFVGQLAKD